MSRAGVPCRNRGRQSASSIGAPTVLIIATRRGSSLRFSRASPAARRPERDGFVYVETATQHGDCAEIDRPCEPHLGSHSYRAESNRVKPTSEIGLGDLTN